MYIAWPYLETCPLPAAIERCTAALQRLTRSLGMPGKYHETISCFFLVLVAERRAAVPAESWPVFRRRNADIFAAQPILDRYYTSRTLNGGRAQRTFVLPDRLAA